MLYKHLKQMKEKPAMYGCNSIDDIHLFIFSYGLALYDKTMQDDEVSDFEHFTDFVKEYYGIDSTHANWAMMIRYHSGSTQGSFDNFFTIFEKFLKKKK